MSSEQTELWDTKTTIRIGRIAIEGAVRARDSMLSCVCRPLGRAAGAGVSKESPWAK